MEAYQSMGIQRTISWLVVGIILLSMGATIAGIFSREGPGPYEIQSIRGMTVPIHGTGIYQHMSRELAPQGIAQDAVTLLLGVPALLISLFLSRRNSLRGKLCLTGVLGYFMVTYFLYLVMTMYSSLFLVYTALCSFSFYAFILMLHSFRLEQLAASVHPGLPSRWMGGFLILIACAMGLLWLKVVVPPLVSGTIPVEVEHYTTLVVQGIDLAILLPGTFISGMLLIRRSPLGLLLGPVCLIFLTLLLAALTAKIIVMTLSGAEVGFPVLMIIPLFWVCAIACAVAGLRYTHSTPSAVQN
jgi:hypothetical protein